MGLARSREGLDWLGIGRVTFSVIGHLLSFIVLFTALKQQGIFVL